MRVITRPESIQGVTWPEIRQLIQVRWMQNELNQEHGFIISCFIVVEANDLMPLVEQEICACLRQIKTTDGKPLDEVFAPSFEWIVSHPSCHEVAFIHCDREFGVCLVIPKSSGIDPDLLELGACYGLPIPEVIALSVKQAAVQAVTH